MKNNKKTSNSSNQIRWVILLLSIAVILPTVCLLYFMTQAAENDRLAMRQRMVDFYTKKINEVFPMPSEDLEFNQSNFLYPNTFIVYDSNDVMVHPILESFETLPDGFDEAAVRAYQFEFQDVNVPAAIEEYSKIAKTNKDERYVFAAEIATVRCLRKIDKNTTTG